MRIGHTEATEAFRAEFVEWLDDHLPDEVVAVDRPTSSAGPPEWARAFQRQMFDDGWLVPGNPTGLGGRGAGLFEQMVHLEELGRRHIVRTFNPQGLGIIAASIISFGNQDQIERYAVPIMRGDKTAALGMSEPGAGSDLAGLRTLAEVDGDEFVVNGQKVWTSGAHDADVLLTFVRTDPQAIKHKGISALLIDTSSSGLTRRPFADVTGRDHTDFNEVFFDDVRVPRANLVGGLNDGWAVCNGALGHERAMLWVMWSQGLDEQIADLIEDLGSTGATDEMDMDRLGRLICDAEALRLLGHQCLAKLERGVDPAEQSLLKLMGSEAQREAALLALEVFGARGLDQRRPERPPQPFGVDRSSETWFHRYLFSFAGTISGGTSEIQRNIIAERVLGLPRGARP